MCVREAIGFGFISDYMRKWREIIKPIERRSNSKPLTFRHSVQNHFMSCLVYPKVIFNRSFILGYTGKKFKSMTTILKKEVGININTTLNSEKVLG